MHEIDGKKVEVVDTETTFEQIYKKEYIPAEYIEDIKRATMIGIGDCRRSKKKNPFNIF